MKKLFSSNNRDFIIDIRLSAKGEGHGKDFKPKYVDAQRSLVEHKQSIVKVTTYIDEYNKHGVMTGKARRVDLSRDEIVSLALILKSFEDNPHIDEYYPEDDLPF